MFIKDEVKTAQHAEQVHKEKHLDQLVQQTAREVRDSHLVSDPDNSPSNFDRQLGKALMDHEVEKRLKRICPNLRFENSPVNPSKKWMWFEFPDGSRFKVMNYEKGLIPEHSLMQQVEKEVLDTDVLLGKYHLNRYDLPKHEIIPHEFNEDGSLKKLGDVIFDDRETRPGLKKVRIPWREVIRGYRTMVAMLRHCGYITVADAEREFGADNRSEWAIHMGKRSRDEKTPW